MLILGIETSCDETSAAVVSSTNNVVNLLSNVVSSSVTLHAQTGGIIPETAAREQIKFIIPAIDQALKDSQYTYKDLDAIAVTAGPGLIGSLLVGVETAKTLSYVWDKPLIPVNHLFGHIYANWVLPPTTYPSSSLSGSTELTVEVLRAEGLPSLIEFPALALVVSGGHTDLVLMENHGKTKWLGGTRDDAAGEAFDKIGRLLNLPYPAGPIIEQKAKLGDPKTFLFPRPMIGSNDLDFSFSGLKTAALREVQKRNASPIRHSEEAEHSEADSRIKSWTNSPRLSFGEAGQGDNFINDMCASVQQAVIDVLVKKTLKAAEQFKVKSILLSGGVAANQTLRNQFELDAKRYSLNAKIFSPPKNLCTDNAAMIASAAFFQKKTVPWEKVTVDPELYFD